MSNERQVLEPDDLTPNELGDGDAAPRGLYRPIADIHDAVTRWLEVNAERVEKLAALESKEPGVWLVEALEEAIQLSEITDWAKRTGRPIVGPLRRVRNARPGRETDIIDPEGRI